jgi:hypothetical protein
MDILSKKTLTLLRDENVRKTIDELIDQRATESKTVELTKAGESGPGDEGRTARVRIRRIA